MNLYKKLLFMYYLSQEESNMEFTYKSIPLGDLEGNCKLPENGNVERLTTAKRLLIVGAVFVLNFMFYGYCVFHAIAPIEFFIGRYDSNSHRYLTETAESNSCSGSNVATHSLMGGIVGATLVTTAFVAIGLSPIGPIAGGLFAANMGASVAAGSFMALLQSAAMTGTAYGTGAAVGAAAGAATACHH
jgi:hypothetical protein